MKFISARSLLVLAVIHFAAAAVIGERAIADYFTLAWMKEVAIILLLPFMVWVLFHTGKAFARREASPIAYLRARIVENQIRFLNAALLLLAYALINRSYRAIKVAIQRIEPFYADPIFLRWDQAIFGTDPWRLTHSIFGDRATWFIDSAYFIWITVILVTFALIAFARDPRFQIRAAASYFLIWVVFGNILAIAMSSAGPCYYEYFFGSDHFDPLFEILGRQELAAPAIQQFLLNAVGDESIGSGISAMPSVHCAMTMLIVLLAYDRFGFGWQLALAFAYHLIILVGSVHLGWHYAVDGLLSTALVPPLWWIVGKFVAELTRSSASSPGL